MHSRTTTPLVCFYYLPQRPAGSQIVIVEQGKIGYTVTDLADARGPAFDGEIVKLLNRARKMDQATATAMWQRAVGRWATAIVGAAVA